MMSSGFTSEAVLKAHHMWPLEKVIVRLDGTSAYDNKSHYLQALNQCELFDQGQKSGLEIPPGNIFDPMGRAFKFHGETSFR